MFNTLTIAPTWVGQIFLMLYILGFVFCIFLKDVLDKTSLNEERKPIRYGILFIIWMLSPAVMVGFAIVTVKAIFKRG